MNEKQKYLKLTLLVYVRLGNEAYIFTGYIKHFVPRGTFYIF